jgi:hypothetical protein
MTQNDFEKLTKEEQNLRWAIFLESDGYRKDLTGNTIENLRQRYLEDKKPLNHNYFK